MTRTVLVVDDSPTERQFLREVLNRHGYDVVMADNAEEALAKSRQLQPDAVLMDVVMPGQSGFQATRALARDERTKHIPVIICTNKKQETDKIWGLRQGAKGYLTKPVVEAELIAELATLGVRPTS